MRPLIETLYHNKFLTSYITATGYSSPEFCSLCLNCDRKSENSKRVSTSAEYKVPKKRTTKQNKENEAYQIFKQLRAALYLTKFIPYVYSPIMITKWLAI